MTDAAIGWGYFDTSEARDKKLLFGTDEDVERYGDVRAVRLWRGSCGWRLRHVSRDH